MNRLPAFRIIFIFAFASVILGEKAVAQTKYWVSFTEKTAKHFDPYQFFDAKTIQNRLQTGQPLSDWYDLPVDSEFIQSVSKIVDSTGYASRWLNGMAVYANLHEINQITALSYVKEVQIMGNHAMSASVGDSETAPSLRDMGSKSKVAEQFDGLEG